MGQWRPGGSSLRGRSAMKRRILIGTTAFFVVAATGLGLTDSGERRFREFLSGFKEAPAIVSTHATGTFSATINKDEDEISYVLTFKNLESNVRQAHIHIGHPQNAGNIVLWLCQTAQNPAPAQVLNSTPSCLQDNPLDERNGRVTGTLTADSVLPLTANGIAAGEFDEVIKLIRAGHTYVNVHSQVITAGEIRSQIDDHNRHGGHDRDRDDHKH